MGVKDSWYHKVVTFLFIIEDLKYLGKLVRNHTFESHKEILVVAAAQGN